MSKINEENGWVKKEDPDKIEDILGFTMTVEIEGMKVVIKFEDGKINTNQLQLSPSQANKLMHVLNKVLGEF